MIRALKFHSSSALKRTICPSIKNKVVVFENCNHVKMCIQPKFPEAQTVIMYNCHPDFVYNWLSPVLFPTIENIYLGSKVENINILHSFYWCAYTSTSTVLDSNIKIYLSDKYTLNGMIPVKIIKHEKIAALISSYIAEPIIFD